MQIMAHLPQVKDLSFSVKSATTKNNNSANLFTTLGGVLDPVVTRWILGNCDTLVLRKIGVWSKKLSSDLKKMAFL